MKKGGSRSSFFNFNSAWSQDHAQGLDFEDRVDRVRSAAHARVKEILSHLMPQGTFEGSEFLAGDVRGNPGKSLKVSLKAEKCGVWQDFATEEKGDLIKLWMASRSCSFTEAIEQIERYLSLDYATEPCNGTPPGRNVAAPWDSRGLNTSDKEVETVLKTSDAGQQTLNKPVSEPGNGPPPVKCGSETRNKKADLGPPTCTWHYRDAEGSVIATVTRYDPKPGEKEFRPWDARLKKASHPEIRPLYNIPGILAGTQRVILVEGEKCADALIKTGHCATTAMGGANAPPAKTDWGPLAGKDVLIWPDNDKPGATYAKNCLDVLKSTAKSVSVLKIPDGKPPKWDAADAVSEGFDVKAFLNQEKDQHQIKILSISDLMSMEFPDNPVIDGLLGEKESLLIVGQSGLGKSIVTLNMALHLAMPATQQEECDFNSTNSLFGIFPIPKPRNSLFIQSENSARATQKRLRKMLEGDPRLKDGIHRIKFPMIHEDIRMMGELMNRSFMDVILKMIEAHQIDVLFIDPLISYHGEDENDNAAMRKTLDQLTLVCDQIGICVIVVHHVGKSTTNSDVFPGRGASGIGDWAANTLILKPGPTDIENEDGTTKTIIECIHHKQRNYEKHPDFYIERTKNLLLYKVVDPRKSAAEGRISIVTEVLSQMGGYSESQKELIDGIMADGNVSRSSAQRMVQEALNKKAINIVPINSKQDAYKLPGCVVEGFERGDRVA